MRTIQRNAILAATTAAAAGLFFAAPREDAEGRAPAPMPQQHVLTGTIKLKGDPPDLEALNKRLLEAMKQKNTDYCLKCDDTEKTQQTYRLGGCDNRQVGNVFVWIIPDKSSFFPISEKQLEEARKRKVVLRQPHCAFIPHCLFLLSEYHPNPEKPRDSEPAGQVLEIVNDAKIGHNTNWSGRRNKGDNVILASEKVRNIDNLMPEAAPVELA
jgi:hypothetical protein